MRRASSSNFTGKLDKTAVALSGLCLVHCLALPLLIAVFPVLGFTVVEHETFHQLILIVVIPTTAIALGVGCRRHRSRLVAVLGILGVLAWWSPPCTPWARRRWSARDRRRRLVGRRPRAQLRAHAALHDHHHAQPAPPG